MPIANQYGVKPLDLVFASFNGTNITPQLADANLLANTFSKMEERQRTANEKMSALNETIGNIRANLINTDQMNEWMDEYSRNIVGTVKNYAKYGDYGLAITSATRLAGEVLNDPALQGRIKFSTAVKADEAKQENRIGKGISRAKFDWYKDTRNLNYEDAIDSNGNIIGGTEYSPMTIYDDVNIAEWAMRAVNMLKADKGSRLITESNTFDNRSTRPMVAGEHVQDPLSSYGESTTIEGIQYERKDPNDILKMLNRLLVENADIFPAIEQQYEVERYNYNKKKEQQVEAANELEKLQYKKATGEWTNDDETKLQEVTEHLATLNEQLQYRNDLLFTNGKTAYKEWFARRIIADLYAKGLSYNWEYVTSDTKKQFAQYDQTKKGSGPGNTEDDTTPEHPKAAGVSVKQSVDFKGDNDKTQAAGNAILDAHE